MTYTLTEIEDAILAALAPLGTGQGGSVKKIDSYGGELDEEKIAQFAVTVPAILVAYAGSVLVPDAYPYLVETGTWAILIADRNLRGNRQARADGPEGTYGLLVSVRLKLHGVRLLSNLRPATLKRQIALANTPSLSIYSAEYEIIQHVRD